MKSKMTEATQQEKKFIEGFLASFRGGRHTRYNDQVIVTVYEKDIDLHKLLGKKVIARVGKKDFIGKVIKVWGEGKVLVRFKKGLDGKALGRTCKIVL